MNKKHIPSKMWPDWANWFAIDYSGSGYFYRNKPVIEESAKHWIFDPEDEHKQILKGGFYSLEVNEDWKSSLVCKAESINDDIISSIYDQVWKKTTTKKWANYIFVLSSGLVALSEKQPMAGRHDWIISGNWEYANPPINVKTAWEFSLQRRPKARKTTTIEKVPINFTDNESIKLELRRLNEKVDNLTELLTKMISDKENVKEKKVEEEQDVWKDAPEWARYHVFDYEGWGHYFEAIPSLVKNQGQLFWKDSNEKRTFLSGKKLSDRAQWKYSLKKRFLTEIIEKEWKENSGKFLDMLYKEIAENAPEWANFHAFDADGKGYYFMIKPTCNQVHFVWHTSNEIIPGQMSKADKYELSRFKKPDIDTLRWEDSLFDLSKAI